jgi:hypothetical protein
MVKNELCRVEKIDRCCLIAELSAALRISGTVKYIGVDEANIKIVTENAAFARRTFSLIKILFNIHPEVTARKSKKLKKHVSYTLIVTPSMGSKMVLENIKISTKTLLKENCCKRSFLRGAFLASGSISDPEKTYHLEITDKDKKLAHELSVLANSFGLNTKIIKRKGTYVIYMKEGENIVDFLNIIGAHTALMSLENVRILKEMRNNVNRLVNCETANLDKTVNASVRQIENIRLIKDKLGFENLPDNLREIAELRLTHKDLNLKELGELLNPVLGKSGVNHRLRKIDVISEKIKK